MLFTSAGWPLAISTLLSATTGPWSFIMKCIWPLSPTQQVLALDSHSQGMEVSKKVRESELARNRPLPTLGRGVRVPKPDLASTESVLPGRKDLTAFQGPPTLP